jgi:hypothetical protein
MVRSVRIFISTMKTLFDRIVFLLNAVSLSLVGLALVDFMLHPLAKDFTYNSALYRAVSILVLTPLTLLVGFLIIRRVPGNIVGPLLILWAGTVAYGALRQEIGPLPFALFSFYEDTIGWLALFAMVLHFPDGKIYPPGAASWLYPLLGSWGILGMLINLSNSTLYTGQVNPFSLPALQNLNGFFTWITILIGTPGMLMVLVSPWLRYRKCSYRERQQIKWLALFGGILIAGTILGLIIYPLITGGEMFSRENTLFSLLFFTAMGLFPPLAIGIAVLRHRLWDIDLIIRRTLVYSILTVILTLIYFGSVAGLQSLFTTVVGHESPAAIVFSTLAIAASITPLRKAIQEYVDRRFYRHKYNAEQVLASFSATLREEIDLDHLTNSISEMVEETMKPAHVSLWLREVDVQPGVRQSEENSSQILS